MPRVPDRLLDAVVFLYPSEDAARAGEQAGGTGVLVQLSEPSVVRDFQYLVTNDHIARATQGGRDIFVRANTGTGHDVLPVPANLWVGHPDLDDVAVAPIEVPQEWRTAPLPWTDFCPTPERMLELNVGIGDDVVMVGRFIGHEGRETNQPMARFGNIALMPGERVLDGRQLMIDAYLIEMRSLPGFSGSPVFVYIGPGSYRGNETMMPFYSETIGLIGVDTGHKYSTSPIIDRQTGQAISEPWEVRQNSGIAIVAPSWKVGEVLASEPLACKRTAG